MNAGTDLAFEQQQSSTQQPSWQLSPETHHCRCSCLLPLFDVAFVHLPGSHLQHNESQSYAKADPLHPFKKRANILIGPLHVLPRGSG